MTVDEFVRQVVNRGRWEVSYMFDIEKMQYKVDAVRKYKGEHFFVSSKVKAEDEFDSDMLDRFNFIVSSFPESRVLFRELYIKLIADEGKEDETESDPFFAGYRYSIERHDG